MHSIMEFLIKYGYMLLFGTVLAEQIGLPVPAAPFLIAAGALAGSGRLNLGHAVALAAAASVVSDSVWFSVGKRRGDAVLKLLSRASLEPGICTSKARSLYSFYGARSLLVSKFLPGLNEIVPLLAGMFKLAPWKFAFVDATAALLWAGAYICLGWVFRGQIEIVGALLERVGVWTGIIVLAPLATYVAVKYFRRQRIYRTLRIARITPQELKERMDTGKTPMIVDLRDAAERREGCIPKSIHLTENIPDSLPALGAKTEVVLYCSCPSELTSARAALQLKRLGIRRVRPLEGGFARWRALGFPIEVTQKEAVSRRLAEAV